MIMYLLYKTLRGHDLGLANGAEVLTTVYEWNIE